MPGVHIITTGGTIASRIDPKSGGAVPAVGAQELVALSPAIRDYAAEVRVSDFGLLQSWNIGPPVMAELARTVAQALDEDAVAGAVVTHGTDTMEETAFALDLLVASPKPVVITGAMRNAGDPDFDGPRNLAAAVRVATTLEARGRGTLLVMNGEVHAARLVTKTHTTAFDTFQSPDAVPVGTVDARGVTFRRGPARRILLPQFRAEPRVYLVKMAAGSDDLMLRTLLDHGAAGVVLEGSGAGNVSDSWHQPIADLIAAGVPVVLVSRCIRGHIVPAYGGRGGGKTLQGLGVIDGGALSGPKARVALSLALGNALRGDALRELFASPRD